MKKKQIMIVLVSALLLALIVVGVILIKEKNKTIDLSDISDMIVGAEMPNIIYYDENKLILNGSFGIIVYNLSSNKITDRISIDEIERLCPDVDPVSALASSDGKEVYYGKFYENPSKAISLSNHKVKDISPDEITIFEIKDKSYDEKYSTFIENELVSNSVASYDDSFVYLACDSDGQIKNLRVVRYYYDDKSKEETKIFQ